MQPFPNRRVCTHVAVAHALVALIILAVCSASAETAGKGGKKGKGKKQQAAGATPSATEGEQSLTNIPLPIGHEAKGLVLPDFDKDGKLRGKFVAASAKRIDQEHVAFTDLKITTYKEADQVDMQIDMQTSTFDLTTKILSSDQRTTVRRSDFNVVGDSAIFDTNARTSRIIGNVKMVITDQSHITQNQNP
jgi:hypothetical protein